MLLPSLANSATITVPTSSLQPVEQSGKYFCASLSGKNILVQLLTTESRSELSAVKQLTKRSLQQEESRLLKHLRSSAVRSNSKKRKNVYQALKATRLLEKYRKQCASGQIPFKPTPTPSSGSSSSSSVDTTPTPFPTADIPSSSSSSSSSSNTCSNGTQDEEEDGIDCGGPCSLPCGDTYYLDPQLGDDQTGDGSNALPWKTIGRAQIIAKGGDLIMLKNGNYGTFSEDPSKYNRTTYLTYRSVEQQQATFDKISISCKDCRAYLRFDGISVFLPETAREYQNYLVCSRGASYLQVTNSKLSSYYMYQAAAALYFTLQNASDPLPSHLLVKNTEATNVVSGIRFHGTDITVSDSHIHRIQSTATGALAGGAWNVTINNCDISDMKHHPEEPYYEYWKDAHASSISVRGNHYNLTNNRIHDTLLGIQFYADDASSSYKIGDILIEGNLIYDINHPFSIYNPGEIHAPIIIRHNTIIGEPRANPEETSNPLLYRFNQTLAVDLSKNPNYQGQGTTIENNIIIEYLMIGNSNKENYSDPSAQWSVNNNLIYARGWAQGTLNQTNTIIYESINAGSLPQDYIDTSLFIHPTYAPSHTLTCAPGGPCDFTPRTGSLTCTLSTTGSYVGAIPCK